MNPSWARFYLEKDGEFIGKDILKENLDYLINKFYDTGDVNLD